MRPDERPISFEADEKRYLEEGRVRKFLPWELARPLFRGGDSIGTGNEIITERPKCTQAQVGQNGRPILRTSAILACAVGHFPAHGTCEEMGAARTLEH
jgi:hypothetical protein